MLAYLIRHAESLANARQSGSLNSRLSDLGHRQCDALVRRLSQSAPVAIYSSPYHRCLETARPLAAALSLPIRVRPELCEFHHQPTATQRKTDLPTLDELVRADPNVTSCPDWTGSFDFPTLDEPFDSLLLRTRGLADYLKSRWTADETVVVISHGSPIARLIDAWLTDVRGPSFRFIIDNAAVSAIRRHDVASSLICLNESSHLASLPAPAGASFNDDGTVKSSPPAGYW